MNFENWLANLLGQAEPEIKRLLQDEMALHFLIAWSLFESKCFNGYVRIKDLEAFSQRIVIKESFKIDSVRKIAEHFHARYQSVDLYKNLMHEQTSTKMASLLEQPFDSLRPEDVVFTVVLTVYRYRNNIFHGSKGIESWLNFKPQILYCTDAMRVFVSHAESITPSLKKPLTAYSCSSCSDPDAA